MAKLSKEKIDRIRELAKDPEYQHGRGCACAWDYWGSQKCPGEGHPVYIKIAEEVGVTSGKVHR